MKRAGPTNGRKVPLPTNIIESSDEDDDEAAVCTRHAYSSMKETLPAFESGSTKPATATVGAPGPDLGNAIGLTAPRFFPPHKVTSQPASDPTPVEDDGKPEDINVEVNVTAQDECEYTKQTAAQVEDDLKELFKGAVVDHEVPRKEDDDVVPSFADGFRLLPHQVQARKWMGERESGRSHGGILADDMG